MTATDPAALFAPGSEVWVSPDPRGDEFAVARCAVVKVIEWARLVTVRDEAGDEWGVSPMSVFGTEAEALADRVRDVRRKRASAAARLAEMDAFLGGVGGP